MSTRLARRCGTKLAGATALALLAGITAAGPATAGPAASPVAVRSGDSPATTVFPADAFTVADASMATGRRVALPTDGCGEQGRSTCDDLAQINTLDGFDLRPRVSIPFDGPIDLTSVTPSTVRVERQDGTSTGLVQLVLDPATNRLTGSTDGYLAEGAAHAVVVTEGVRAADGSPVDVGPNGVLRVPFTTMTATGQLARIRAALDDGSAYTGAGIADRRMSFTAGAASGRQVFLGPTVQTITRRNQVKADAGAAGAFSEERVLESPPAALSSIGFGSIESPRYADSGGVIATTATTVTPAPLRAERIGTLVLLPATAKPAGGYPVAVFGPGFSRSKYDALLAADFLVARGVAVVATDPLGHAFGPRSSVTVAQGVSSSTFSAFGRSVDIDGDGILTSTEGVGPLSAAAPRANETDPVVPTAPSPRQAINLRDGLIQTVVDNMALVRSIRAGVDVDGLAGSDLSTSDIGYYGQSFGGIYGTMLLGTDPTLTVGALNVPGGPIADIARESAFRASTRRILDANEPELLNGGPGLEGFTESIPLRTDPPVTAPVAGSAAIRDSIDRTTWVSRAGSPDAYAALFRPGQPAAGKALLYQVALGDHTVPNPTSAELLRAGELFGRTTLYRNDRTATFALDPHGFLLDPRITGRSLGQLQITEFLISGGSTVLDPDGAGPVFEVPVADPRILDCLHYADPQTGQPYAGRPSETGCPAPEQGGGPAPVIPEVPYAALIPLLAIGLGGAVLYRRSRRDD